jgi:hypothetical protein
VSETQSDLEHTLDSHRQIGLAKGVLMAHHKITQDQTFTLLRVASQICTPMLRDLAVEVTERPGCCLTRRAGTPRSDTRRAGLFALVPSERFTGSLTLDAGHDVGGGVAEFDVATPGGPAQDRERVFRAAPLLTHQDVRWPGR